MTPHTSGTSLSAQARYAAGTREILECWFDGRPIREEYLIVDGGKLAGAGAHSYSEGDATGRLRGSRLIPFKAHRAEGYLLSAIVLLAEARSASSFLRATSPSSAMSVGSCWTGRSAMIGSLFERFSYLCTSGAERARDVSRRADLLVGEVGQGAGVSEFESCTVLSEKSRFNWHRAVLRLGVNDPRGNHLTQMELLWSDASVSPSCSIKGSLIDRELCATWEAIRDLISTSNRAGGFPGALVSGLKGSLRVRTVWRLRAACCKFRP